MAIHTGIALCSGIGGLELGISLVLESSYSTVCYVEREAFPASLLVKRMEDGILDHAPIWSDLTTFDGRRWRGCVDIISAGIPCQPFSVAGKRKGFEDDRWIWDDVERIIRDVGPRFVFLENVPGINRSGLPSILRTLAEGGFNAEWDLFRASDVGAPHKRERWFLLADSERELARFDKPGRRNGQGRADQAEPGQSREKLADSDGEGLEGREQPRGKHTDKRDARKGSYSRPFPPGPEAPPEAYEAGLEPSICRVANGIPNRVDRLRVLGNGVVPAMGALAFRTLLGRIHGW